MALNGSLKCGRGRNRRGIYVKVYNYMYFWTKRASTLGCDLIWEIHSIAGADILRY
jgi:hypothetical protein